MIDVKETYKEGYKDNMKKKLYGLLREREKDGEWEKFLDSILIELMGYDDNKKQLNIILYLINYHLVDICLLNIIEKQSLIV